MIGDITYVINEPETLEYAVSYFNRMMPYGYAIITISNGEAAVKEGQLVKDKEGPRATMKEMDIFYQFWDIEWQLKF